MARPQKFRHSIESLNDPQIAEKLGRLVLDIENLRLKREQIDAQIAAAFDAVDDAGFDKKFVRKVVSLRAKDGDARRDEEAGIEAYEFAVERGVSLASARRKRENVDPETGEVFGDANAKLIATVATGMQTEIGRKALVKALDVMIEREEAEEHRSNAGLNILTKHTEITASDGASPAVPPLAGSARDEESAVSNSPDTATECAAPERDAAAGERSVEADGGAALVRTLPEHTADQAEEGDHEVATGSAKRAGLADPASNRGEGAACALPDNVELEYVPRSPVKRLPFADCFPGHSEAEYKRLEKDIVANRVQKPIVRQGDVIIDGFARYCISRRYGMSYPIIEYTGTDVLIDVIEWQRSSRNFTPAQEKKIAADLAKEIPHRADDIFAAFRLAEALEAAQ